MPEPNEHRTEDLAFATFLRVKGQTPIRVEKPQPNRADSKRACVFALTSEDLQAREPAIADGFC